MERPQLDSEAKANKRESVCTLVGLHEYLPQPQPVHLSPKPGLKRKRTKTFETETKADEPEDVRPLKQYRERFASGPEFFDKNLHDGFEAQANEPLGLKKTCTYEQSGQLNPREQTDLADNVQISEPRRTPKLYFGHSMDRPADESAWLHFADFLAASSRVLCLVGAGLSAPSGLTTWRGTNGLWNDINSKELASLKKFKEDPVTVWNFYGDRLLKSLAARPNAAHYALAALANWHGEWLTINQNVDGTYSILEDRQMLAVH
jgi:hypothetical protein